MNKYIILAATSSLLLVGCKDERRQFMSGCQEVNGQGYEEFCACLFTSIENDLTSEDLTMYITMSDGDTSMGEAMEEFDVSIARLMGVMDRANASLDRAYEGECGPSE